MTLPNLLVWLGERFPFSTELLNEKSMQQYDNLYLDITEIVKKSCNTQINDSQNDIEKQTWNNIFETIGNLVTEIKPEKFLLLTMDGVTPRAIENEQRTRGYSDTTNSWSQDNTLDTNCVIAGTTFTSKLTQQIQYFINKKISEDVEWRNLEVILSGPNVPGEAQQKIIEQIRFSRSQPGYNPNTRHCIYGIEDSKVLLGLASHEPNFSLLCEESVLRKQKYYSSSSTKKFTILHLCVVREYLDMEFALLKTFLPFGYEFERILDDFILLCLLTRNEVLPRLPHLEDFEESLELVIGIYKDVLPLFDGYIQDGGRIILERLEKVIENIAILVEKDAFEAEYNRKPYKETPLYDLSRQKSTIPADMTENQAEIFSKVRDFLTGVSTSPYLRFNFPFSVEDKSFTNELTRRLKLSSFFSFSQAHQISELELSFLKNFYADEMDAQSATTPEPGANENDDDRKSILNKYSDLKIISVKEKEEIIQKKKKKEFDDALERWKHMYYQEKLNLDTRNLQQMTHLVGSYIIGIQWVLHYFYEGVISWDWFYPYNYAPKALDIKEMAHHQDHSFILGQPPNPFEHLMMVLPVASAKLLPGAYVPFMTEHHSPLREYYPTYFQIDSSGEKPILSIPFINKSRLQSTIATKNHELSPKELERNQVRDAQRFIYDSYLAQKNKADCPVYKNPSPEHFPDIQPCLTQVTPYTLPGGPNSFYKKGLLPGVKLGKETVTGFPSLHHLDYNYEMAEHDVRVFGSKSVNDSMIISIRNKFSGQDIKNVAHDLLFRRVYVGYPTLKKAIVIGVSDINGEYRIEGEPNAPRGVSWHGSDQSSFEQWNSHRTRLENMYNKQKGAITGHSKFMVRVCLLEELKKNEDGTVTEKYSNPSVNSLVLAQILVFGASSFAAPRAVSETFVDTSHNISAWHNFAEEESRNRVVR